MLRAVASGGDQTVTNLDVASGGSIDIYNTSPISSADYERLRLDWSSNVARVWTGNNGTGVGRSMRIGSSGSDADTGPNVYTTYSSTASPWFTNSVAASSGVTGVWNELASFPGMIASSGTQTAVAVSPTFAQTSTAAGIALLVNPSGTFGSGGGKLQSWQLAGAEMAYVNNSGSFLGAAVIAGAGGYFGIATGAVGTSPDVTLQRDAADTLALRRTTNAQTFRVYHSYTDSSNYSRWSVSWNTSTAILKAEGAGTGTNGNTAFGSAALATNATVGYVMIPSCAGVPTGVPADIPTGQVALHFDSTNNKLYVYDGGWISVALA